MNTGRVDFDDLNQIYFSDDVHVHVQIDCNVQNCKLRYINATLSTSLTIDCAGSSCDGSTIICPVRDGSNCTFDCSEEDGSCKYMSVQNGAGGDIDTFTMLCPLDGSCAQSVIELDPNSISKISIFCGEGQVQCIQKC